MYLNSHFKLSEEAVKGYRKKFNAAVKKQYPGIKTVMDKNGKIIRKHVYHKYTLKSPHLTTMTYIHRAYYAHLKNLQASGQPIDTPFELNNQALATMKGCSRYTIYRHINYILQNINEDTKKPILKDWPDPLIISKKKSGRYFEITLNPKYIHAEQNNTLTKLIAEQRPDIIEEAAKTGNDTLFLNPSFAVIFPLYVAFCNSIEKQDTSKNKNIEIGICSKSDSDRIAQETILQETQKHQYPTENLPAVPERITPGAIFNIPPEKDFYGQKIEAHIERAIWYYLTFLYSGISVSAAHYQDIKKHLYNFFKGSRSYWTRGAFFIKLVNIQLNTNKRRFDIDQPLPWQWLDTSRAFSIRATEEYYHQKIAPMEAKNKEWNSHKRLLDDTITWYLRNKGVPGAYKKCCEAIGRKGKGKLMDEFNKVVLHEKNYQKVLFSDLKVQYFDQKVNFSDLS